MKRKTQRQTTETPGSEKETNRRGPAPEIQPPDEERLDMDKKTFDLKRLRLSQDFPSQVGKKAILTVPVRKPDRQWFIRVHPEPTWRLETAVLELKEERETYIVDPDMWPELPGELVPKVLFTAINRQGVVFLWPVRLPGEDGRGNAWHRSALQAADLAMTGWVRSFTLGSDPLNIDSNLGITALVLSWVITCLGRMETKSPDLTARHAGKPTAYRWVIFSRSVWDEEA